MKSLLHVAVSFGWWIGSHQGYMSRVSLYGVPHILISSSSSRSPTSLLISALLSAVNVPAGSAWPAHTSESGREGESTQIFVGAPPVCENLSLTLLPSCTLQTW